MMPKKNLGSRTFLLQGGYTPTTLCELGISRWSAVSSHSKKAEVLALLGKSLDHIVRRAFRCDVMFAVIH